MKHTELMAITGFIATVTPVMQANPLGGLLTAGVALGLAYIWRRHGK